ncbi:MAG: hypothetical protein ACM3SY_20940 [Candidatus Omnitrophota bacterium]
MKNKIKFTLLLVMFLVTVYFLARRIPVTPVDPNDMKVLLIRSDGHSTATAPIVAAYQSVLEEEGVPFMFQSPAFLLSHSPADMVHTYPVIIFPDGIAQSLPPDIGQWIDEYLSEGGNVAVIFDAGAKDMKGHFMDQAVFTEVTGIDYMLYNRMRNSNNAYTSAFVRFENKQYADRFQVTPGKLDEKYYVNGYLYGRLTFPIAQAQVLKPLGPGELLASAVTASRTTFPVLVLKKHLAGNLLYVNLPLGHIKANSDDFWIRSILRTFLFDIARVPHLMNTPGGKGGIVINWHIDWYMDGKGIEYMTKNGFFPPHIRYSLHNTAGDFTQTPGDHLGFDACGKGKSILQEAIKGGTLGSHGGWGHDWFYKNILAGRFKGPEIETYIVKNMQCLQQVAGYPIIEYSAPNGVHPQPLVTSILEKHGVIAYYYTGDSGSAPNRTFFDRKMVSPSVIAFPVTSLEACSSLFEIENSALRLDQVIQWYQDLISFTEKNRTVRLIYSHCADIEPYYPNQIKDFIDNVEKRAAEGKLNAQPMSFFARFLLRFLKTGYRFSLQPNGWDIRLKNPEGLEGVTIAIPKDRCRKPYFRNTLVDEDKDYYYLEITGTDHEQMFHINFNDVNDVNNVNNTFNHR